MFQHRLSCRLFSAILVIAAVIGLTTFASAAVPDLEQRVRFEDRIQRAYLERRAEVTPSKSGTTEEPRATEALRAKVEKHLRMTDALEQVWGETVTADDLQAEYDRILEHSTDPVMLNRLLEALDRDPVAIAAGLVEPIVVRRAVHGAFWWDDAIHGDLRHTAEDEVRTADDRGRLGLFTGERAEMEIRLAEMPGPETDADENGVYVRTVGPGEWSRIVGDLADGFGVPHASAENLPLFRAGSVEETKEYFSASIILERDADHIRLASLTWWKQTFSEWWSENEPRFSSEASREVAPIRLERLLNQKGSGSPAPKDTLRTIDEWLPMNCDDPDVPSSRLRHTVVWTGTQMIVWGGRQGTNFFSSGGIYDPATDSWTATSQGTHCPTPRVDHTANLATAKMVIWGGWKGDDDTNRSDGGIYDPVTDTWEEIPAHSDSMARHFHGAFDFMHDVPLYIWGGMDLYGTLPMDDGLIYNPSSGTYTDWDLSNQPGKRDRFVALVDYTFGNFFVWGGIYWNDYLNTGGLYDLATGTWAATPTDGAPTARIGATAVESAGVCTPSPVIVVWGGYNSDQFPQMLDSGGTFSPADNVWTGPTPGGENLPDNRDQHTAVMDPIKDRMIIWGGDAVGPGGVLDLCTDTWTDVDDGFDLDLPMRRRQHSAVWTGTTMLIWGGVNDGGGGFRDDGAVYTYCWNDPSTTQLPTVEDEDPCATGGIRISWNNSFNWGDYDVQRRVAILRDGEVIAQDLLASDLSYLDTTAVPDQSYDYQVQFFNSCGADVTTTAVSGVDGESSSPTMTTAPTAEDSDGCNPGSGIDITWPVDPDDWGDNGADGRKYRVWRWQDPINGWVALGDQIDYPTATYHDPAPASGKYRVNYINGCGQSANSAETPMVYDLVGSGPTVSQTVTAEDADDCVISGNSITWPADPDDWGDNDEGDRFYRVRRSTDGINFNPIGSNIPYPATGWVDPNTTADQTYYYQVRYKNGCELDGDSAADTATDIEGEAPTGFASGAEDPDTCNDGGVTISWQQDADSWGDHGPDTRTYDVLRDGTPVQSDIAYGTTSFVDTTGDNGTAYTYTVRYNNSCGYSGATTGDSGNDRPFQPDEPINNNTASDVDGCAATGVLVTWDADVDGNWGDGGGLHTYSVLRDGVPVASDLTFGTTSFTDTTGDANTPYLYTVRYVNCGDLYFETAGVTMTDVAAPGAPANPAVVDASACDQDGVWIAWAPSAGATSYDIRIDGSTEVTDVTSPYLYDPADSASHTYEIRANSDACTGDWSQSIDLADLVDPEALFCSGFRSGDTSDWDVPAR